MIKIGVLCPSEIAIRRFMPALMKVNNVVFVGIAHASEEEWYGSISSNHDLTVLNTDFAKAKDFVNHFGGKVFNSYDEIIKSNEIDALYIPLPPGLHYKWAKKTLENGKHVLVEKPSTTSLKDTEDLVSVAETKNLVIYENYMFNFHSQISSIEKMIDDKLIGDIRLYRITFGFPFRGITDFRYNKKLGGGALLDCGGYTLKLANRLLKHNPKVVEHTLNYVNDFDVDIYGSGTLKNDLNQVAQISFGMDNSYKCELEVWGSKGVIFTNRILTAPVDYNPVVKIIVGNDEKTITLSSDDSFKKSIEYFINCISNETLRNNTYIDLIEQAKMVEVFKEN